MTSGPSVSSGTRECQKEARSELSRGVDDAVYTFAGTLSNLALKHERSEKYVRALAGIGHVKRATTHPATVYGAFLSNKLKAENEGKQIGSKMTLQGLLGKYGRALPAEFKRLEKDDKKELLDNFNEAKETKANTPKKLSNVALGKIVDHNIRQITSTCQELYQYYGTECLVIFSCGNSTHRYASASYATPKAEALLAGAEIGHSNPDNVAMQLEGFAVSGYTGPVEKPIDAPESAKTKYRVVKMACRNMIQEGLENILKLKKYPNPKARMNYDNYERQIVERLGVELIGWPLHGCIRQPGKLPTDDAIILRNALNRGDCKWVRLTPEQVAARKATNLMCNANGETIYGPPRKPRMRNKVPVNGEEDSSANDEQVDDQIPMV